ncbi:HPr Serine kinase C-terminal domain-containing protein [Bacillus sp. OV322]|uniref:HPr kinase/phosphorylase n=1 Tax=Bacillus sp. OV322 TaxID=1882764 RepID=UPI0008E77B2A|nr:aldolase [Bacillus sp. OV322]SFC52271.1 HPr Serine kinase C-terminal domain-containing protein [Bacillus sp. OV322]
MISTLSKTIYKAFGLTLSSDIHLPELPLRKLDVEYQSDVVIEEAELYDMWSAHSEPGDDFVIKQNLVMYHLDEKAIFLVQDGNKIFYSPFEGSHEREIRLYLLGTCMGAILLQREIMPIHGSAIAINGKAYAIVGDSGAGKSTLASALMKRGYRLLSDDVIPVTLNDNHQPIVTPSYPQQKLWLDSLKHFGMKSTRYQPLIVREDKFAVPVPSQFAAESLPLAGVFELVTDDSDAIEIQQFLGLERFYKLFYHTYRNFFIQRSGLMEWHFNLCTKMINQFGFYQLRRPVNRFTANDLADMIVKTIHGGGKRS